MLVSLTCFWFIIALLGTDVVADPPDPSRDRLTRALHNYDNQRSSAREEMLRALDHRIESFARRGEFEAVNALKIERKRYEEHGVVPSHESLDRVITHYEAGRTRAIEQVRTAYEQAIRLHTRTLEINRAEAIRTEFEQWLQAQQALQEARVLLDDGPWDRLTNEQRAFANRRYVWVNIPPELSGWWFRRTRGGVSERITIQVVEVGYVWVASSHIDRLIKADSSWEQADLQFNYTDHQGRRVGVARRWFDVGEHEIDGVGWTGTVVLAPPHETDGS